MNSLVSGECGEVRVFVDKAVRFYSGFFEIRVIRRVSSVRSRRLGYLDKRLVSFYSSLDSLGVLGEEVRWGIVIRLG